MKDARQDMSDKPCAIAKPLSKFVVRICQRCGYRRNAAAVLYRYARCDDFICNSQVNHR